MIGLLHLDNHAKSAKEGEPEGGIYQQILEELEGSIGYLTAGKLNDVQANKLLSNMTKIDEVFNPKQIPNIG